MDIKKIIKKVLNEQAGISQEVREWSKVILDVVKQKLGTEEPFTINGKDYPEIYENFKVDKWVINPSNNFEYDHNTSGYDDQGDYVVNFNLKLDKVTFDVLVHEIKHAYDDWNRMSRGHKPIRDSWEVKNLYTKDFERLIMVDKNKYPNIGEIMKKYYLASKLETPAYLENELNEPGKYRDIGRKLRDYDIKRYFNKKGQLVSNIEQEFEQVKQNYDIPFIKKFKNVIDFLNYTQKYFNKRGTDIIKRVDKALYIHKKL